MFHNTGGVFYEVEPAPKNKTNNNNNIEKKGNNEIKEINQN